MHRKIRACFLIAIAALATAASAADEAKESDFRFRLAGPGVGNRIAAVGMAIAVIATLTAIYAMGFTLNYMTLMALSLCIGLLIDDAIVVRENIVRHLGMGKDPRRASLEGTQEVGLAVLATTLTIVAVFVPIAFMKGSGSSCSMLYTPLPRQAPVSIISAPTAAGTPVV